MAYTKKLIGNVTKGAIRPRGEKRIQYIADTVDENLANIETEINSLSIEGVADVVGAMFSGNSEVGVSAAYQDTDNTIDLTVAYGTEPGAVSSSTSGSAGTADSASRSDHNHDLGAHAHTGATDGGVDSISGGPDGAIYTGGPWRCSDRPCVQRCADRHNQRIDTGAVAGGDR